MKYLYTYWFKYHGAFYTAVANEIKNNNFGSLIKISLIHAYTSLLCLAYCYHMIKSSVF